MGYDPFRLLFACPTPPYCGQLAWLTNLVPACPRPTPFLIYRSFLSSSPLTIYTAYRKRPSLCDKILG